MNYILRLENVVNRYIEGIILPSDPLDPLWNRENFIFHKQPKWNYIDNCMITSVLRLYEHTMDEKLLYFAEKFTSAYVDDDGFIPTLNPSDFNLDNINGGKNLLTLYRLTGEKRWIEGAKRLAVLLDNQPRLDCGNFWHKAIYPHQIWLDGAYMAFPFMVEYGLLTGEDRYIDDVLRQISSIKNLMRDPATGLYFHGYDETRSMDWADPITGLSSEFWLRSMGWLCAALADVSRFLPENREIPDMLIPLLSALVQRTDEDGMLYQLPDRRDLPGNYAETSGTLLFAYAALRVNANDSSVKAIKRAGKQALEAVSQKYIFVENDEKCNDDIPVLRNICLMAGLGQNRSGRAEYYLSEPVTENDAKGIAPLIMAYTELMKGENSDE